MCFASAHSRQRLFMLYHQLVTKWGIEEEELRSAVELNRLKEMLMFRCSQTRDPVILGHMQWLQNQQGFGANGQGPGLVAVFDAAREELLNPDDRKVTIAELQPKEKRMAFVFYVQIRNEFKPDVDEDNWISLGFCTAKDTESEQHLAFAYGMLVERCLFDEFWNAMAESTVVRLFIKYGLVEQVSHIRHFNDFMLIVNKAYPSVWQLKRSRLNVADPFRAVVVDYGFMNCQDARQRLQLREIYRQYFELGMNEMRLHEACIAGKLASFLQSVFGKLEVPLHLLQNPYPLENRPLAGMVMDRIIIGTKSNLDRLRDLKSDDENKKAVRFIIPDADDDATKSLIYDYAAFSGAGLRKRYYSGADGKVIMQLTLSN